MPANGNIRYRPRPDFQGIQRRVSVARGLAEVGITICQRVQRRGSAIIVNRHLNIGQSGAAIVGLGDGESNIPALDDRHRVCTDVDVGATDVNCYVEPFVVIGGVGDFFFGLRVAMLFCCTVADGSKSSLIVNNVVIEFRIGGFIPCPFLTNLKDVIVGHAFIGC